MVLVWLALPLVEVSVAPLFGSFIVGTGIYMHATGYSWKTNQYGLTVDSVTEFHLVSPNGTQIVVHCLPLTGIWQSRPKKRSPNSFRSHMTTRQRN